MALVTVNSGIAVAAANLVCSIPEKSVISVLTSNLGENLKRDVIDDFLRRFKLMTGTDRVSFFACIFSLRMFLLDIGFMNSFLLLIHKILEAARSGTILRALA